MTVPSVCAICGGSVRPGTTTFTADLGTGVVVVRNVKAAVCSQCGEDWIDSDTTRQLEQIVEEARARKDAHLVAMHEKERAPP